MNCARSFFTPLLIVAILTLLLAARLPAQAPPSAVAPLLKLLQGGTLPPERVGNVAKMVCERGNEHDLAYVFSRVTQPESWPIELRRDALEWLHEAAATRKLQPAGDLDGLATLIASERDRRVRQRAVELAGLWKVPAAVEPLQRVAADPKAARPLREAAMTSLISFGGDVAEATIAKLLQKEQSVDVRMRGAAALAGIDLDRAAKVAAEVLQTAGSQDDPAPLVDAFLNRRQGADRLAAALEAAPPSADVALLSLRHMYAVGRSDPALEGLLSRLAGINAEAPKLSEDEIKALAAVAASEGDAVRGEAVFRRADLACTRCHAVSKGGGQIGPDLSAVGASSPVDYLVKSIYDPDAQKKEEYLTRILLTTEGQQFTGIVTNRTEDKLVLKTAEGKLVDVAVADVDFEAEGKSLMPEGLVKFMTRQEILDVVKFLSMLGKPNTPYAIRTTQRMQRWRVLLNPPEALLAGTPNEELFSDLVLQATTWEPVYGRVNGELPLSELTAKTKQPVLFVQGEADVTAGGPVGYRLDAADGVQMWVDDQSLASAAEGTVTLEPGRHTVTLRVDTAARRTGTLKLELFRPSGSNAQFAVVDGQ